MEKASRCNVCGALENAVFLSLTLNRCRKCTIDVLNTVMATYGNNGQVARITELLWQQILSDCSKYLQPKEIQSKNTGEHKEDLTIQYGILLQKIKKINTPAELLK